MMWPQVESATSGLKVPGQHLAIDLVRRTRFAAGIGRLLKLRALRAKSPAPSCPGDGTQPLFA